VVRTAQGSFELGIYEVSNGEIQKTFPTTDGSNIVSLSAQGISGFSNLIEDRQRGARENVEVTYGGVLIYSEG
jgi:hypothetical protein